MFYITLGAKIGVVWLFELAVKDPQIVKLAELSAKH